MSGAGFVILGLFGFFAATFGPPALALLFWRDLAKHMPGWLAHALFLPSAIALEWCAVWLIFFAAHDDGDGPPGLGLAIIPPLTVFLATIAIYYLSLVLRFLMQFWHAEID